MPATAAPLLALLGALPASPSQGQVDLADLAACLMRLEATLERHAPSEERRALVERRFDAATRRFFLADFATAVRELDALRCELLPESGRTGARVCTALRLRPDPEVHALGSPGPLRVWLEPVYELLLDEDESVLAELVLCDASGRVRASCPVSLQEDATFPLEQRLELEPWPEIPESFSLELRSAGESHAQAFLGIAPAPPAEAAASHLAALEALALEGEELERAARVFRARVRLLTADPSKDASALSRLDPVRLQLELAAERVLLAAGRDPYPGRRGELWRVVVVGRTEVPLRLFVPPDRPASEPLPLVIAFHGAGGNENMFFDAYGRGILRAEAERRGFALAAPSTYAFLRGEASFDALLSELERCLPVDPERVFLLGHSLGAGAADRLARTRAERVAAVACLAGGGGFEARAEAVPLLVALGELDGIVPSAPLARAAERAREAGRRVELFRMAGRGHTLMVGEAVPAALDFFEACVPPR
jgi:predicted esterase